MASAAAGPNFELLSNEDLDKLLQDSDAVSTKKSMKFGFSKLESFAKLKNVDLSSLSTANNTVELDVLLKSFYASLRRDDGSLYSKKSLHYIRYGVQRHFSDNFNINITDKGQFPESVRMYKAVLVKLKKEGLGSTQHKDAISNDDIYIIIR